MKLAIDMTDTVIEHPIIERIISATKERQNASFGFMNCMVQDYLDHFLFLAEFINHNKTTFYAKKMGDLTYIIDYLKKQKCSDGQISQIMENLKDPNFIPGIPTIFRKQLGDDIRLLEYIITELRRDSNPDHIENNVKKLLSQRQRYFVKNSKAQPA